MSIRGIAARTAWVVFAGLVITFTIAFVTADGRDPAQAKAQTRPSGRDGNKRPAPAPELTPGDVVKIVMGALKNNDAKDAGIATTFDFASPENKKVTGPLQRFIPMVKTPVYAPMLNFKSATYGKIFVKDDLAQQAVKLVDAKGNDAVYVFRLSKQTDGDLKGCWLTDGVVRVDPHEEPAPPKLNDPDDEDRPDRA